MPYSGTLQGKTILVTGGGSGLGKAMASHFSQCGANLVLVGRNFEKLKQAAGEMGPEEAVLPLPFDVRDPDAVERGVEQAVHRFGSLDCLVNNAAGNFLCPTENLSPNGFKAVVDTVLMGTFHCTLAVGKRMIRAGGGRILNIITNYAETGASFVAPSAAAKAGVLNLTRTLAVEWAKYRIAVNAVAPGPIPTEGAWKALMPDQDIEQFTIDGIPQKRFGTPLELARVAEFLLSEEAAYITGTSVALDGGQSLADNPFNRLALHPPKNLKDLFKKP